MQTDQSLQAGDQLAQVHAAATGSQSEHFLAVRFPALEEVFFVSFAFDHRLEVSAVPARQVPDGQVAAGDRSGKDPAREVALADLPLPGRDQIADAAHAL